MDGNNYDYGFRIYNPQLGRFLSLDPLQTKYPWYTPYQFSGNKPISNIDADGREDYFYSYSSYEKNGKLYMHINKDHAYDDPVTTFFELGMATYHLQPKGSTDPNAELRFDSYEAMKDAAAKFAFGQADFNKSVEASKGNGANNIVKIAAISLALHAHDATRGFVEAKLAETEPASIIQTQSAAANGADITATNSSSITKVRPVGMSAMEWGNELHYDQLNGGNGVGLPTELAAKYPNTVFEFTGRGIKGADVKYVSGMHPSQYPGSTWDPANDYGDFKTVSDTKFNSEINSGKLPANTQKLTYDPKTGKLQ
jgi:hypothetical protein